MSKLFTPFFTTKPAGMGLGLPVIQQTLEAHCGRVEVESVPGEGACFRLVLPVWTGDEPADQGEQT